MGMGMDMGMGMEDGYGYYDYYRALGHVHLIPKLLAL